jgi:hypothetical protein
MYDTFGPFRPTSYRVELRLLSPIGPLRIYRHSSLTAVLSERSPVPTWPVRGIRLAQLPGLDRTSSERGASMVSESGHQGQEKYGNPLEKQGRVEPAFHDSGSRLPLWASQQPIPLVTCRDADETVGHEFHLRKGRIGFRVDRCCPRLRPVSPMVRDAGFAAARRAAKLRRASLYGFRGRPVKESDRSREKTGQNGSAFPRRRKACSISGLRISGLHARFP